MYDYRMKSKKKLKLMKSLVTEDNVTLAIADDRFWRYVLRVRHTYPKTGGRNYLFLLVGKPLFNFINTFLAVKIET